MKINTCKSGETSWRNSAANNRVPAKHRERNRNVGKTMMPWRADLLHHQPNKNSKSYHVLSCFINYELVLFFCIRMKRVFVSQYDF
jgi:hypothetical protein